MNKNMSPIFSLKDSIDDMKAKQF